MKETRKRKKLKWEREEGGNGEKGKENKIGRNEGSSKEGKECGREGREAGKARHTCHNMQRQQICTWTESQLPLLSFFRQDYQIIFMIK